MRDRVPGAPGKYKAQISQEEFYKMEGGEPFSLKIVRDDDPKDEGTPINKETLLPDDVAAAICPEVEEPVPADALIALHKSKVEKTEFETLKEKADTTAYIGAAGDYYVGNVLYERKAGDPWGAIEFNFTTHGARIRAYTEAGGKPVSDDYYYGSLTSDKTYTKRWKIDDEFHKFVVDGNSGGYITVHSVRSDLYSPILSERISRVEPFAGVSSSVVFSKGDVKKPKKVLNCKLTKNIPYCAVTSYSHNPTPGNEDDDVIEYFQVGVMQGTKFVAFAKGVGTDKVKFTSTEDVDELWMRVVTKENKDLGRFISAKFDVTVVPYSAVASDQLYQGKPLGSDITYLNSEEEFLNKFRQAKRLPRFHSVLQYDKDENGNLIGGPREPLVLAHFSDIHADTANLQRIIAFCDKYKRTADEAGKVTGYIDDVLFGGDTPKAHITIPDSDTYTSGKYEEYINSFNSALKNEDDKLSVSEPYDDNYIYERDGDPVEVELKTGEKVFKANWKKTTVEKVTNSDVSFWNSTQGVSKILVTTGNHDYKNEHDYGLNNTPFPSGKPYSTNPATVHEALFKGTKIVGGVQQTWDAESEWGAHFPTAKATDAEGNEYTYTPNYYYKDYPDSTSGKENDVNANVRLIVVDYFDWDEEKPTDCAQYSWLSNCLKDAKEKEYHVVISSHYPAATVQDGDNIPVSPLNSVDCTFHSLQKRQASNTFHFEAAELVQDFIDTEIEIQLSDGKTKKVKGKFVCWLTGHTHLDWFGTLQHFPKQLNVSIGCASSRSSAISVGDMERIVGEKSQDLFNIVSIDTYNKTLKIFRVGANYDSWLRKKDTVCWDYENSKLIYN